ncbi:MAG: Rad52/Rad22 family DNA repair protein [Dehalococcoidia bacterium]
MSYLSPKQVEVLLRPIHPSRVEDLRGMSYVAQHDVRAHMNRIFGFARWSTQVIQSEFIFEEQDANNRWKAAYRATVRVEVHAPDGTVLATYEDCHVSGNAPQPDRAEAHALALTSAVSTAFKRACTNLGDQFGLSLYEKGQRTAIVKSTLMEYNYDGDAAGSADTIEGPDAAGTGTSSDPDEVPLSPDQIEAESMKSALDEIAAEHKDNDGDRIMAIAAFKSLVDSDWLSVVIPSVGITVGAYADKVATNTQES